MSSRSFRLAALAVAALAVMALVASGALGAGKKRSFTMHFVGAQINATTDVYKVTSSLDGPGAAVQVSKLTSTTPPLTGTDTAKAYFADGVSVTKDTFTLSPPDANGISQITGKGHCTGGTRVHRRETCTYTFTGTLNTNNTVVDVKVKGTSTR